MSDTPHDPVEAPLKDTEQGVDPDGLGEAQLREERDQVEGEDRPDPYDVEERAEQSGRPG